MRTINQIFHYFLREGKMALRGRRWNKRSRMQLREHPLCVLCLQSGKVEAAAVADHVIPHKGDSALFWRGELQSLCWSCHSSSKQQKELNGFCCSIGADGFPVDPLHPFYK